MTGNIDACFGTSFPSLQLLYLHDCDFSGSIPSVWNLTSLISLVLSNNKKLNGPFPETLFTQNGIASSKWRPGDELNSVIRAVIIEGTRIGGSIPEALCSAVNLETLALSGNELSSSLPTCLASLAELATLAAASNSLSGALPRSFGSMSSLTVLDLSDNYFGGRFPAELGSLSPQLVSSSLQLNRLSCDLPSTVLNWELSPDFEELNVLVGNSFGCSSSDGALALEMGGKGLHRANYEEVKSYSCGASEFVVPVAIIILIAPPTLFGTWRAWRSDQKTFFTSVLTSVPPGLECIRGLTALVGLVAVLAVCTVVPVLFTSALSFLECPYAATWTMSHRSMDDATSSTVLGATACASCTIAAAITWRLRFQQTITTTKTITTTMEEVMDQKYLDAPSSPRPSRLCSRILKVLAYFIAIACASIGPNAAYVYVQLSPALSYTQKQNSVLAITAAKVLLSTLAIPAVSRLACSTLLPDAQASNRVFKLRIFLTTALSACFTVIFPIAVVVLSDELCLYSLFVPPQKETTSSSTVQYCFVYTNGQCSTFIEDSVDSTYSTRFHFKGQRCASEIIEIYAPVFLLAVVLAAAFPAAVELMLVPSLAPLCQRNYSTSALSRWTLSALRMSTWVVPVSLMRWGYSGREVSYDANYFARRVVERGVNQSVNTLLVSLSFGLAAPFVGVACSFAACIQFTHHYVVLERIRSSSTGHATVPLELTGFDSLSASSAVTISATSIFVWILFALACFDHVLAFVGASSVLPLIGALGWVGSRWFRGVRASKGPFPHEQPFLGACEEDFEQERPPS